MFKFIYGKHPVVELLKLHPECAKKLWYISDEHLKFLPAVPAVKQKTDARTLSREFALKSFESHQGLLLELTTDLNKLLSKSLEELVVETSNRSKNLIWLPQIQDAHNLGAIVRSSAALGGIYGLVIPASHGVKLSPTVAKVSAGAIFRMQFAFFHNQKNTALTLKSAGFSLLGVHKSERSVPLPKFSFESSQPYALIFGAEGEGIPSSLFPYLDAQISIPQSEQIDSLNLSVAASITLYEMQRAKT